MFKRLILIFLLFTKLLFADIESYYVGLRAFEDGFYDVSAYNLEDYLNEDNSSDKAVFSKYILYKIYLIKKNFDKSRFYLNQIKELDDKRFDKIEIAKDNVFLTALNSCEEAYRLIDELRDPNLYKALLGTNCAIDNNTENIDPKLLPDKMKYFFILQTNDIEKIKEAFKHLDLKKLTNEELKVLSIRLYKLDLMNQFWTVYERYRDQDTINLAIERVWKVGKYEDVLKGYQYNRDKKLLPSTYCMVVDANFKLEKSFDCNLVDLCFETKDDNYLKTKLSCLALHGDIKRIKQFVKGIGDNYTTFFCQSAEYLIINDLIETKRYNLFQRCDNLDNLSEELAKRGLWNKLLYLRSGMNDEKSYFYLAYVYGVKNDRRQFNKYYNLVKDKNLKDRLLKRFRRVVR